MATPTPSQGEPGHLLGKHAALAAWEEYLKGLPNEPWDVYTDAPRGGQDSSTLASVPLEVPQRHDDESEVELDIMLASSVALAACDRGRRIIWLADAFAASGDASGAELSVGELPPLPLRVELAEGTLAEAKERLRHERVRVATLRHESAVAVGSAATAAVLHQPPPLGVALPRAPFEAQRAHPVCQLGFRRTEVGHAAAPQHPYDFEVHFAPHCDAGATAASLLYRADLFDAATAQTIAQHITALLRAAPEWSATTLVNCGHLMLNEAERTQLLEAWGCTAAPFEEGLCIHELFERCARGACASRAAVIPFEADDSTWSYAELDQAAGAISRAISELGLPTRAPMPFMVPRSKLLVASIYGILRAGLAYVPLDPDWPRERQRLVVEDVNASALVICAGITLQSEDLSSASSPLALLRVSERLLGAEPNCPVSVAVYAFTPATNRGAQESTSMRPSDSAYVLYTSGTTGRPKGVNVPHRGLVGRTEWLQHTWPLVAGNVVAHKTPAGFAISEWELFWPLCYGATIALAADGLHGDAQHVAELFARRAVTHSVFVPSLLELFLDEMQGAAGTPVPALRLVIACGEALTANVARACREGLPHAELVNLYGPTEGSMTMLRIPTVPSPRDLLRCPIGVPIENTIILCTAGQPPELALAPVLACGELLFGGPLIATGYWGLPELTGEKFVPNPYAPGRAYRTGDLGRWRADGSLEFLGRVDNQVKFNGVRIELGEIEAALSALHGVRSAAAFLSPPHLVAACVVAAGSDGNASRMALEARLFESLRACLPRDRLPTRLDLRDEFPMTERGKVDRKRLREDFEKREQDKKAKAAADAAVRGPETSPGAGGLASETERIIEAAMRELLGCSEPLPVTANFQALGFSSLALGKLTSRVRRGCALPALPATAVYRHPTARELAIFVEQQVEFEATEASAYTEILPAEQVWRGGSPTSLLSWACTLCGIMGQTVVGEYAFLPAYYVLFAIYFAYGMSWVFVCLVPVVILGDIFVTIAVQVILKWLILGKRREGVYPIFGWYYWKWWFMRTTEHYIETHVSTLFTDSPVYNLILRLLGADIGCGASLNMPHIGDVDLVSVGRNARVERQATLEPARLWRGELHLRRIRIGEGARVSHRAFMPGGTSLPPYMELTAMSSTDKSGPYHVVPIKGGIMEDHSIIYSLLQLLVGIPIIGILEGLSELPALAAIHYIQRWLVRRLVRQKGNAGFDGRARHRRWGWSYVFGTKEGFTLQGKQMVLYPLCMTIPWVMTFVHGGSYFFLVVMVKWIIVGKFQTGPVTGPWDRFCRWLMERLTTSPTFNDFMELWVNTEILAVWYRLLGCKIAPRVNMDFFGCVEHDLVRVERDVVLGSSVLLVNTQWGRTQTIAIEREACALDNSCILPGVTLPKGALLGSFTVVPQDTVLEPMTVYTGCENGTCVKLFRRPGVVEGAPLTQAAATQRELEQRALARHHSDFWFVLFNVWCVLSAFIFAPLPDLAYWMTIIIDFEIYDLFRESELGEIVSVALIAPLHLVITLLMFAVFVTFKWLLVGRWTAGDRPYYTWFHFRWAGLMTAYASMSQLMEQIVGTPMILMVMRSLGASVGKRVCFFGHGFEYDLLHIGDNACVGSNCDVTAHTVENMVMKMEHVRFEAGASCLGGSVVMPGATMEPWSTLIEHSQVLKGETVPTGTTYGGLPAKLLRSYVIQSSVEPEGIARELAHVEDVGMEEPLLTGSPVVRRSSLAAQRHAGLELSRLSSSVVAALGRSEAASAGTLASEATDSSSLFSGGWSLLAAGV